VERDPRERVVAVAYYALVKLSEHNVRAGGPRDERSATLQDWAMKQLRADGET